MRVLVSDRARADAVDIYSYLIGRNPAAAERVLERIERKLEQLSQFPFVGPGRSGLGENVRAAVAGKHLVLYKIETETVIVLRIIDGRMDVEEEFRR